MFKKVVTVAGLVAMLAISVSGQIQNARIGAMGGVTNIDDISNVYLNPAFVNAYKNDIQVSFNNDVIGIKSVGENMVVGAAFNTYLMMVSDFYTPAMVFVDGLAALNLRDTILGHGGIQRTPHLLLGFNLDAMKIGLDIFHEYRGISYHAEQTTTAGTIKGDLHKALVNLGFIVGLNINTGSVPLSFLAGMSFPMIDGSIKASNNAGVTLADQKVRSAFGLMLRFGLETSTPIDAGTLTLGAKYQTEMYRFENVDNLAIPATIATSDTLGFHFISPYIGYKVPVVENIMLSVMEKATIQIANRDSADLANVTAHFNQITFTDTICLGAEKSFPKILFLDSLALRGGFSYPISVIITNTKRVAAGPTTIITSAAGSTMWGPATAYLGLGGSFGPCTIDLLLNPAAWTVAIGGPEVARCTATLNF